MGVAQIKRAGVTQVLVFVSLFRGPKTGTTFWSHSLAKKPPLAGLLLSEQPPPPPPRPGSEGSGSLCALGGEPRCSVAERVKRLNQLGLKQEPPIVSPS